MKTQDRYDSLIKFYTDKYDLRFSIIKEQIMAESSGKEAAISPVGAKGLAQFMPNAWQDWNKIDDYPITQDMIEELKEDLVNIGADIDIDLIKEDQIKDIMRKLMDHPYNPEEAIEAMCRYMSYLYRRFSEIPNRDERYKFALASYNAGRGHINKALSLAREEEGFPASFSVWQKQGKPEGKFQKWNFTKTFLSEITGKHASETINYIKKISENI